MGASRMQLLLSGRKQTLVCKTGGCQRSSTVAVLPSMQFLLVMAFCIVNRVTKAAGARKLSIAHDFEAIQQHHVSPQDTPRQN